MVKRARSPNDVIGGLFLIAIAVTALWLTHSLRQGSAVEMGAGYVPRLLCAAQLLFGIIMLVQGLRTEGPELERWVPRPILFILASVTFFAATVESMGLVVAIFGVVLLAAGANRGTRPVETVVMAAILAAFCVLGFVKGLGLSMPIIPTLWGN